MVHVSKLVETFKVPNAQSVQKVEWASGAKNARTVTLVIQGVIMDQSGHVKNATAIKMWIKMPLAIVMILLASAFVVLITRMDPIAKCAKLAFLGTLWHLKRSVIPLVVKYVSATQLVPIMMRLHYCQSAPLSPETVAVSPKSLDAIVTGAKMVISTLTVAKAVIPVTAIPLVLSTRPAM
jgi:hypothetical protein